jgi:NitT/TauT family transport system substrate-binding protein
MKRTLAVLFAALATAALAGCSLDSQSQSDDTVNVVIGYQSKTINTVTAGTLLKAKRFLEQRLAEVSNTSGKKYNVQWQDYDTGAPITAQMVAEKIDIGSMGDYPLLINGSKTQANERSRTEFVSVTGYSPTGSLNMVVVPPNSPIRSIADLKGKKVSASVGSAGHGTLVRALDNAGIDPKTGVEVLNQQPQIGASALESGQAQALSQFVAWPGLLVFQNKAELLYDGAEGDYPTFHGVVVRRDYAGQHPEVVDAFLRPNSMPPTSSTRTRWSPPGSSPRAAACRRKSSTSTTAPAAPASTPRSSRHSSTRSRATCPTSSPSVTSPT